MKKRNASILKLVVHWWLLSRVSLFHIPWSFWQGHHRHPQSPFFSLFSPWSVMKEWKGVQEWLLLMLNRSWVCISFFIFYFKKIRKEFSENCCPPPLLMIPPSTKWNKTKMCSYSGRCMVRHLTLPPIFAPFISWFIIISVFSSWIA